MKKKSVTMLSFGLCMLFATPLASCNKNKHEAKGEWTYDATKHWHECVTKGHDDRLDEANHSWDAGVITTKPTENSNGIRTYTCTVCIATKTESVDKLAHTHVFDMTGWEKDETHHWHKATCGHDVKKDEETHAFGEWTEKTAAGIHVDRVEERKCSVCEYKEERTVANTGIHDYDIENIRHDETNHWFECSCGEKSEVEAHTYGDWAEKTAAAADQDRQLSKKCKVCEYENVLTFEGTRTNGSYCMAIDDILTINGVKNVFVKMLRGTISVGDNLIVDGVTGEFSVGKITDVATRKEVATAKYGDRVSLQLEEDSGDLNEIKVGSLAYMPDSVQAYREFTALIRITESSYSGKLYPGRQVYMDLYDVEKGLMIYKLALPEGVNVTREGESYLVTVKIPDNASKALWPGMDFKYKIYDSSTSSYVTVVDGIVLTAVA